MGKPVEKWSLQSAWEAAWERASARGEPSLSWTARELRACSLTTRLLAEALYRWREAGASGQRIDAVLLTGETVTSAIASALPYPMSEADLIPLAALVTELEDAKLLLAMGMGHWQLALGRAWSTEDGRPSVH